MSYREKMCPAVSKAEIEVFKVLSQRGLTYGMVTQSPIILKLTIPDFQWPQKKKVVYLDGAQVHQKKQEADDEITNMLEIRGWQVLRITYTAPASREKLLEITDKIQEFLGIEDPRESDKK